jgi:uncharacterized protein
VTGIPYSARRRWTTTMTVTLSLWLAACATSGPPPVTYVLGPPVAATESVEPLTRKPVVEVKPVLVPDYLDVSDILVRRAPNALVASSTGRWGERLSVGATRALTLGLTRRLPGFAVTSIQPTDRLARQVLAEVESFESRADGSVVLVARWRVLDGAGRNTLSGERVSLVVPSTGTDDAAIVAAMSGAIENLTERVAGGLR